MFGTITIRKLAIKNIMHQKFRSTILFLLFMIITIGIFGENYISYSMQRGLKTAADRIGADIIVVPDTFVTDVEDALFRGKTCTVNFDSKWIDKISRIEGIKQIGSQLYMTSLGEQACCDETIQLIAFDINTDITVGPWISSSGVKSLNDNEVIVGCKLNKKKGDIVKYFGKKFTIKSVLEETGMGYDRCVFLSYNAAYKIACDPIYAKTLSFTNGNKSVSMIFIKVKEGYSPESVGKAIETQYKKSGVSVYITSATLSDYANQLEKFKVFGVLSGSLILLLAIVSLFAVITITFQMRQNELGSLMSIGIKREKLTTMFLWEYVYIVLPATVLGISVIILILLLFHNAIKLFLQIPYLLPQLNTFILLGLETLVINCIVCFIASIYSFFHIRTWNPIDMVKR